MLHPDAFKMLFLKLGRLCAHTAALKCGVMLCSAPTRRLLLTLAIKTFADGIAAAGSHFLLADRQMRSRGLGVVLLSFPSPNNNKATKACGRAEDHWLTKWASECGFKPRGCWSAGDFHDVAANFAEKNIQLSGSRAEEKASLMSGVRGRRGRTGWRPQNGNRESRKNPQVATKVRLIKTPVSADH